MKSHSVKCTECELEKGYDQFSKRNKTGDIIDTVKNVSTTIDGLERCYLLRTPKRNTVTSVKRRINDLKSNIVIKNGKRSRRWVERLELPFMQPHNPKKKTQRSLT